MSSAARRGTRKQFALLPASQRSTLQVPSDNDAACRARRLISLPVSTSGGGALWNDDNLSELLSDRRQRYGSQRVGHVAARGERRRDETPHVFYELLLL